MLVGRDEIINSLANQSVRRQLVTIVGPAGVGKSSVASAIAGHTADRYANGTVFVDLASVDDERPLELALAAALGIPPAASYPTSSLIAYLSPMELLLVVDNCEHLVGPLAYLTEEIVRCAPKVDVLVTSREPLRCSGEWLYRLSPLRVPSESPPTSVDQALHSPAVCLFVESATRSLSGFRLSDANMATVVGICRELDGIPLAIQLVAARVRNFSVEELARAVSRQPLLLARGWRSANVSHHASLQSALDWTYTRLSAEEQLVFRRLAVFRGAFCAYSATEVAGVSEQERARLPDILLSLAEKSLVGSDSAEPRTPYRLLHVARSYALEKLIATGELNSLLRRHASHYSSALSNSMEQGTLTSREEWLDRYRYALDDIRAALEWAFSDSGDPDIAAQLTVASLPVMFHLCLVEEFQRWIDTALQVLERSGAHTLIPQARLHLALCSMYVNIGCQQDGVVFESAQRAVDTADRIGDELLPMMARITQIICHVERGNPAAAVQLTAQLGPLVARARDPFIGAMFDRVSAQAHHFNGDLAKARTHAQRALQYARQPVAVPIMYSTYSVDHRVSMRIILARSAWLEGRADDAAQIANEGVELARRDRPFTLAQVLAMCACPIAFWRGDLAAARTFTAELLQCGRRYGLQASVEFSRCYRLILGQLDGEDTALLGLAHPVSSLQFDHLATVSDQWLNGAMLARAEQGLTGWCTAEILRRHGERLLRKSEPGASRAADERFQQALGLARAQGAHAWEVRILMSLVRLHRHGARYDSSLQELKIAYERLQGGQDDADTVEARALLDGRCPFRENTRCSTEAIM